MTYEPDWSGAVEGYTNVEVGDIDRLIVGDALELDKRPTTVDSRTVVYAKLG